MKIFDELLADWESILSLGKVLCLDANDGGMVVETDQDWVDMEEHPQPNVVFFVEEPAQQRTELPSAAQSRPKGVIFRKVADVARHVPVPEMECAEPKQRATKELSSWLDSSTSMQASNSGGGNMSWPISQRKAAPHVLFGGPNNAESRPPHLPDRLPRQPRPSVGEGIAPLENLPHVRTFPDIDQQDQYSSDTDRHVHFEKAITVELIEEVKLPGYQSRPNNEKILWHLIPGAHR
eukprot:CAMPEP_0206425136 /NCGR_PEP_ID=MMETSP0324_2-20121206/3626_1 /ASSEMBLY_ACC=CAM_ASM_000836 /TAXON_ID=2866 /ORGANISM="Crypthecodinium cohnii, Strain Seligo" /LENGTH=235 /DNA_ID=CAMNT_0053889889 /DNA_START=249 /DNA_END=956 /DNA_ORIENTATION=+